MQKNSDLKEEYKLSDYVDPLYISKNGFFKTVGSAKSHNKEYVLCYALNYEYLSIAIKNPCVSAIIIPPSLKVETNKAIVIYNEPDILYCKILNEMIKKEYIFPNMQYAISKNVLIDKTARVSSKSYIGENVVIGKNVIINDYTIIEDNCIIGDNVVLGCDGLYFKRNKEGKLVKFLHAGGVHLEKDVEILTGSMVQRAHDAEFTTIGEGTKISVNVNIGHSVHIGRHNMITGNVQIAGRVQIGDYCWIGTSSTISDSVKIGNNVTIRIGSVVVKDIKEDEEVSGNFAYNHTKRIRNFVKEIR